MKRLLAAAFAVLLSAGLAGCKKLQTTIIDGTGLGTTYHIVVRGHIAQEELRTLVDSLMETADDSYSIFNPNSLLSRLNRGETNVADNHIVQCLELARYVSEQSGGLYDVTVKPLVQAWGFTGQEGQLNPNLDSIMPYIGYKKVSVEGLTIHRPRGLQIDLNSIAKGYTVDLIAREIATRGAENYLVEVGGEIACRGTNAKGKPWTVGIDRPEEGNYAPGQDIVSVVSLTNAGLATSGNYRNFRIDENGKVISHTINPLTGYPERNDMLSATIIAPTCAIADAYASMMMLIGSERAIEFLENSTDLKGELLFSNHKGRMLRFSTIEE